MVQTAWNVLEDVLKLWQKEPYRWMKERDLQAEIGGRLNQIFALQGLDVVVGKYKWAVQGFDNQSWSRVAYEPYVGYEYEKGKYSYCYPDIVIWDYLEPGEKVPENQLWPILWACELKYGSSDDGSGDVEKLKKLLKQQLIKFGCAIRVHFKKKLGIGIEWNKVEDRRHLWICEVSAPETKNS